jgi:hypothetical protein
MNGAPRIGPTRFDAGVHSFWKVEKDLRAGTEEMESCRTLKLSNKRLEPFRFPVGVRR